VVESIADMSSCSDSGGQYRDGTCDTTRTVHFGRPTPDQCEAYTRVLQGHVCIRILFICPDNNLDTRRSRLIVRYFLRARLDTSWMC